MFGTKYAVAVQERIDELANGENCNALQDEFDTAEANNEAMIERTGSGTADLMEYIDGRMREAGCY